MAFSDTLCAGARSIWEAFLTSSRYAYGFWDTAHRMEGRPV
jgi:hypothetical protein